MVTYKAMGNSFKERRETLGHDLKQVSGSTRIKVSHLKAIEEEDFGKLPVEVYSKGYIREYSRFLGIGCDDVLAAYESYLDEARGGKPARKKESSGEAQPSQKETVTDAKELKAPIEKPATSISPDEALSRESVSVKPSSNSLAVMIFLAVVVCGAAFYMYIADADRAPEPVAQPQVSVRVPEQEARPLTDQQTQTPPAVPVVNTMQTAVAMPPAPKPVVVEVTPPKQPQVPEQKKKHSLQVTATDTVWLQLVIDGSYAGHRTLKAGDRLDYGADKTFKVRIGNAGGLKLIYDGKELNSLGSSGQVVDLELPVKAAPQHTEATPKDKQPAQPQTPGPANSQPAGR